MIETIWPLSVLSCGRDTSIDGKSQNLIGLRTFVQEVLRRSKTSYSTLQVALYYLVLIQSCLPGHDFTMEQREDSPACRAMQCGRRMFLASLILASKYLQDRNFSARAWSKISGLKASEINANEIAFLKAVNWKLHIPEPVFHRWTDIVLKYSPSASPVASPRSSPHAVASWRAVIPHLTPALDTTDFGHAELAPRTCGITPETHRSLPKHLETWSKSNESTPTNASKIPNTLEPTPRASCTGNAGLPALPRLGPLPTPKLTTPQPSSFTPTFSSPAVGAEGLGPRRTSMSIAMEQAQKASMARATLDPLNPPWRSTLPKHFPTFARPSLLARSNSLSSPETPETMVSDRSSRCSRSSSISSVSSSCSLPPPKPGGLAAQAARRCANRKLSDIRESTASAYCQPTVLHSLTENAKSREPWLGKKGTSASPDMPIVYSGNYSGKSLGQESMSSTAAVEHAAAVVLSNLGLGHQPRGGACTMRPAQSRKRSRTSSMDLGVQESVRDLTNSRCLGQLPNGMRGSGDDGTVLPDGKVADSFLVPKMRECHVNGGLKENQAKSIKGANEGSRKRPCGNASRHGLMRGPGLLSGPGMWDGII
ncbi:MAG: hypothetical protein Q9168_006970 [Polycauliona sp. 1 TL-2023]